MGSWYICLYTDLNTIYKEIAVELKRLFEGIVSLTKNTELKIENN